MLYPASRSASHTFIRFPSAAVVSACSSSFSPGFVLGSKNFVEDIFTTQRDHFGPRRKHGARRIVQSTSPFYALRQLRVRPLD